MRRRKIWLSISLLLFASALAFGRFDRARAAEGSTFIIAATDGYGVEDCLAERGECGRVVADAWCEAHGQGHARSYGLSDDVTGAIATSARPVKSQGAYFITCGD